MTPEYRDFLEIQTLKEEIQKLDIDARSADALRLIEIKELRLLELCRRATTLQPRFVKEGKGYFDENNEWKWKEGEEEEALPPIEVPAGPILLKGKRWEHLLERLEETDTQVRPIKGTTDEPSPVPKYALLNLKEHWKLFWNGEEGIKRQGGWKYVHHCMQYPKHAFTNIELDKHFSSKVSTFVQGEQLKEGFKVGDLRTLMERETIWDFTTVKQVKNRIKELNNEIENLENKGQSDLANGLHIERDEIENLMTECVQKGKIKVYKDTQTSVNKKINQAVRRAIQSLPPEPYRYFTQAFRPINSSKKCYNPEKLIEFILE